MKAGARKFNRAFAGTLTALISHTTFCPSQSKSLSEPELKKVIEKLGLGKGIYNPDESIRCLLEEKIPYGNWHDLGTAIVDETPNDDLYGDRTLRLFLCSGPADNRSFALSYEQAVSPLSPGLRE